MCGMTLVGALNVKGRGETGTNCLVHGRANVQYVLPHRYLLQNKMEPRRKDHSMVWNSKCTKVRRRFTVSTSTLRNCRTSDEVAQRKHRNEQKTLEEFGWQRINSRTEKKSSEVFVFLRGFYRIKFKTNTRAKNAAEATRKSCGSWESLGVIVTSSFPFVFCSPKHPDSTVHLSPSFFWGTGFSVKFLGLRGYLLEVSLIGVTEPKNSVK